MSKYRIVVEDTTTHLYAKTFEAPTREDAKLLAESEWPEWRRGRRLTPEGWADFDEYVNAEIRDDLCEELP